MRNNGVAARLVDIYARGLLDLADPSGQTQAIEDDLDVLAQVLVQEPRFGAFLASPYFSERAKRDLVGKVFADRLHRLVLNFVSVVIDHGRGALLPEMIERYKQLHREARGFQTVQVTVAQAMSGGQLGGLMRELGDAIAAKVDLDVRVDPSIIGGVIIRYGDKMLDNSVRGRLLQAVGRMTDPQKRQERTP